LNYKQRKMPEYQCQRCGYKFDKDRKPYTCPYCGEIGTLKPTPTASDLLNEVSREEKREEKKKED